MAIVSGDIPDIITVNGQQLLRLYESGQIADLTEAYENCASDHIKEIYDSMAAHAWMRRHLMSG